MTTQRAVESHQTCAVHPLPCACGARYKWDDPKGVVVETNRFRVWVACAACGASGEPAGIRGSARQAQRLAVLNWNAEREEGA